MEKSDADSAVNKHYRIIWIMVPIIGLLLITVSFWMKVDYPVHSEIGMVIGGSMVGTSMSMFLNSSINDYKVKKHIDVMNDIKDDISSLIEKSSRSLLHASDSDKNLEPFRKEWHGYFMTQFRGKKIWRYRCLDFSTACIPNKLVASFKVTIDNQEHEYDAEGFLVGSRLLLVVKARIGGETPAIHIFPSAGDINSTLYAGIVVLKSWDTHNMLTKSIMSLEKLPLDKIEYKEGFLDNDRVGEALEEKWRLNSVSSEPKRLEIVLKQTPEQPAVIPKDIAC